MHTSRSLRGPRARLGRSAPNAACAYFPQDTDSKVKAAARHPAPQRARSVPGALRSGSGGQQAALTARRQEPPRTEPPEHATPTMGRQGDTGEPACGVCSRSERRPARCSRPRRGQLQRRAARVSGSCGADGGRQRVRGPQGPPGASPGGVRSLAARPGEDRSGAEPGDTRPGARRGWRRRAGECGHKPREALAPGHAQRQKSLRPASERGHRGLTERLVADSMAMSFLRAHRRPCLRWSRTCR